MSQGRVTDPESDKRLKENQEGEPYQVKAGKIGGQARGGGGDEGGDEDFGGRGPQGRVTDPSSDKRLKENQEGEPYQVKAGQMGGQARSND